MQMARRIWLGLAVLALGAAACGDSDDPVYGPEIRQADAETICNAACERSAVCLDVENPDLAECVDACATDLVANSSENKCTYTRADIRACAGAYADFSCSALEAFEGPTECTWDCDTPSARLTLPR